jgi:hypothetical protein
MMNEDKRKEAQKKLEDEERVRRLQEGGETMKAELAMEEAQRSSQDVKGRDYLTPQEQKRREMLESKGPYRGYGESQQAEMAMWEAQRGQEVTGERYAKEVRGETRGSMTKEEMRRTGSDQVGFPAGSGSFYSETGEKPTGIAGPEGSFGRSGHMPSGKQYAEGGLGAGRPSERNLSQEEMARSLPASLVPRDHSEGADICRAVGSMLKKMYPSKRSSRVGWVLDPPLRQQLQARWGRLLGWSRRREVQPWRKARSMEMLPCPRVRK